MIQTFLLSSLAPPGEGAMGPTGQARAPDGWDSMFADALMSFLLDQDGENLDSLAGAAGVLPPGVPVSVDTAFPVIETSGEAAAPAAGVPGTPPEATAASAAALGSVTPAGGESLTEPAPVPSGAAETTAVPTAGGESTGAQAAPAGQTVGEPAGVQPVTGSSVTTPVSAAGSTEGSDAGVEPPAQAKPVQSRPATEPAQADASTNAPEPAVEALTKEKTAQTAASTPPAATDLPAEGIAVQAEAVVDPAAPAGAPPLPSQPESPVANQPAVQAVAAKDQDILMQMVRTIQTSVQQGQSSLRLQLHPQELGSIDVRLVSNPHGVGVTVFADQASTGRLLEMQIDQLRVALQDAGVQISHLNVFQQSQQRHEAPADWNRRPPNRRQTAFAGQDLPAADAVDGPRLGQSMVDYRV